MDTAAPDLDAVRAASEKLLTDLRHLGLYADIDSDVTIRELPDGSVGVVVDALVGDLAFSKRVQDPEQHDFDGEFRKMMRSSESDRFMEKRDELERRIREGKPLFGDA